MKNYLFLTLIAFSLSVFSALYAATPIGKQWQSTQNAPFQVKNVQLSWEHPTEREDSTPLALNEISHYVIEVSKDGSTRTFAVAKSLSYTMKKLRSGTYQFRIATVDRDGLQGRFSEMIEVVI